MLKKISNINFFNDFDIIELKKIRNNYFAIIMNKIPYFYIQIIPYEKMKNEFQEKLQMFLENNM